MKLPTVSQPNQHTPSQGIVERPPGELKPWPGNPRVHSEKQLALLKASIQKFGFTAPVLVDEDGNILGGHGRVLAAIGLNLPSVPTRIIHGLSTAQKRAYVIADNKLGSLSTWDTNLLRQELHILSHQEIDIEVTGFSTAEIDLIFEEPTTQNSGDPDGPGMDDTSPDVVSVLGDIWQLDQHLLLCGDATNEVSYRRLMGNDLAQMVITDPPYNVPINGHVSGNGKTKHKEFTMGSGEMTSAQFSTFLGQAMRQSHDFSVDGAIHYYFMDWRHLGELTAAALPHFGGPRQVCVWVKDNGGMGSFYRSQHELVYVFKKGSASHINNFELGQHGRYRTNVWNYPGANSFKDKQLLTLHPTVKPTSMIADAMRDCSHRKGLVLDPFAGSGTVLMAAERTGRRARAMELDPQYVDVGIRRWERLTGKNAILAGTQKTWADVQQQRLAQPTN